MSTRTHTRRWPLRQQLPLLLALLPLVALALATALIAYIDSRSAGGANRQAVPSSAGWVAADGPHTVMHGMVRAPWGTLYIGSSQGVFASSDRGFSWHLLGRNFPGPGVEAWSVAALRTSTSGVVLAVAGDGFVYRIARNGGVWRRAGSAIGVHGAFAVYALPGTAIVLAGSDQGIYRSVDAGNSWTKAAAVGNGDVAVAAFARDPAGGLIYAGLAGTASSVLISRDDGRNWSAARGPLPAPSVEALLAANGTLYAGVMRTIGGEAVWQQGPHGFAVLADGLPRESHGMALAALDGSGGPLFVGTMGVGVYRKTVHGSWARLGQRPGDGIVLSLLVLPDSPSVLLAGTGEGVYRYSLQ